ncbi:M15 family metallopeptidase [Oscillatoria sp. CS-180]|uniref:M15 family metallopeptidase n=1 Tax=Oscillatoria sp. CS-180 TaxID=3021720 RepID=UPI00232C1B7B|nr:M15 family metallopeptidase [Oscillatoria sp. CS-180]MDB9526714.1 M15 family metallopeptidase [Oscillatoria sp. CS-180]
MEPRFYSSGDDIPEAQRDRPSSTKGGAKRGIFRWVVWFLIGLSSAIAGLIVSWLTYQGAETSAISVPMEPMVSVYVAPNANDLVGTSSSRESLLGHFAYEEAPETELVSSAYDSAVQLRPSAVEQFDAMVAEAESQGIYLVPISGFRAIEDQHYLFFDVKAERGQTPLTRAEVSAPPGYSEHHTGYAIDIADANAPGTDLSVAFEETDAFKWLEKNAPRYSFELSFPRGNPQGVQYEPWHWRFVGDSESLKTFYQDR